MEITKDTLLNARKEAGHNANTASYYIGTSTTTISRIETTGTLPKSKIIQNAILAYIKKHTKEKKHD